MFTKITTLVALASMAAASQHIARAEATACDASLSAIITDMPTMPAAVISRTITDSCTVDLPLTLSDPFMSAFTSFVYWGAEVSQESNEWAAKCDPDAEKLQELTEPFAIGGADCSDVWLVFSDAKETKSILAASAFADENFTFTETGAEGTTPSTSASAGASQTSAEEATRTGDAEASDASGSGGAAASTAADGDDGSGAATIGARAAVAAGLAGVAGLAVAL